MIAARHAAGNLQIDDAISARGCGGSTSRNTTPSAAVDIGTEMRSSPSERVEPRHVPALVDQPASPHLADFVDAVGKLISAILDATLAASRGNVAAVDVCDA